MVSPEYLNEERVKLWAKTQELESLIGNVQQTILETHNTDKKELDKKLKELDKNVLEVRGIANAKTPENVQTAMSAAQSAVQKKEEIETILQYVITRKKEIDSTEKLLREVSDMQQKVISVYVESNNAIKEIIDNKKIVESNAKIIVEILNKAQKAESESQAKWTTANQQAQNIANLSAQTTADIANIKVSKDSIETTKKEILLLKDVCDKEHKLWTDKFVALEDESSTNLDSLLTDKKNILDALYNNQEKLLTKLHEEFTEKHTELSQTIETLLPGATSVALATAFAERKIAIEKTKTFWAGALIVSAIGLVIFGFISLYCPNSHDVISSIPARMIIIAGLIILEEFARRNYNIISRLAESYAYKEALAKSYLGYKKEMMDICMPDKDISAETKSVSVLVKTFLDKLEDEPGKHVFDKEKQVTGISSALEKLSQGNSESTTEKTIGELSNGNILTKITWPIAVVVAILSIAVCIIIYILKT